jgi:hypothetical protein
MTYIERLRPDPIPAIHPLPEYLASGQRGAWYEDTKRVLQVPWMGVVTMAYSHYPNFFGELWRGLKPLCESRPFVEAFLELREFVEVETAQLNPRAVYEDVKQRLKLPFVNTDYRAFARWPSYFALAWNDLRESVVTEAHEAVCQACHERVAKLAAEELPNPGGLSSEALRRAAEADGSLDEVIHMCRLFQWLLPGLITNVAFLRHQLEAI